MRDPSLHTQLTRTQATSQNLQQPDFVEGFDDFSSPFNWKDGFMDCLRLSHSCIPEWNPNLVMKCITLRGHHMFPVLLAAISHWWAAVLDLRKLYRVWETLIQKFSFLCCDLKQFKLHSVLAGSLALPLRALHASFQVPPVGSFPTLSESGSDAALRPRTMVFAFLGPCPCWREGGHGGTGQKDPSTGSWGGVCPRVPDVLDCTSLCPVTRSIVGDS